MKSLFSQQLKRQREKRLLSISELARRSGLSKSAVSMLESGSRRPGLASIRKLEAGLGLSGEEQAHFRETALNARHDQTSAEPELPDQETFRRMLLDAMHRPVPAAEQEALAKIMKTVHRRSQE